MQKKLLLPLVIFFCSNCKFHFFRSCFNDFLFTVILFPAEILGLHTKGRLAMSGEELETLDSFQLGDAVDQVYYHTAKLA